MQQKRWPMVVMTIVMILLIFNFLNTIFKSDVKRYSHNRIYVDYSQYSPRYSTPAASSYSNYNSSYIGKQIEMGRSSLHSQFKATAKAFDDQMAKRLAKIPAPGTKPAQKILDPEFQEIERLAKINYPAFSYGQRLFKATQYENALSEYHELLKALPKNDFFHRIKIFEAIAECYFKMENRDGYIQYKIWQIKAMRDFGEKAKRVYPDAANHDFGPWFTIEEATQNLLKIRAHNAREPDTQKNRQKLLRSELDLEVARRVN